MTQLDVPISEVTVLSIGIKIDSDKLTGIKEDILALGIPKGTPLSDLLDTVLSQPDTVGETKYTYDVIPEGVGPDAFRVAGDATLALRTDHVIIGDTGMRYLVATTQYDAANDWTVVRVYPGTLPAIRQISAYAPPIIVSVPKPSILSTFVSKIWPF